MVTAASAAAQSTGTVTIVGALTAADDATSTDIAEADVTTGTRVTTVPVMLSQLSAPQASAAARAKSQARRVAKMHDAFTSEPLAENEDLWESALYATTVMFPGTPEMRDGIRKALRAHTSASLEFQRSAMEAAYGFHPQAFLVEMAQISEDTTTPKLFAMAGLYLARGMPPESGAAVDVLARMRTKFPNWQQDPILTMLNHDLQCVPRVGATPTHDDASTTVAAADCAPVRPPLRAMFSKAFATSATVVYTLQRHNRDYPGIAVVRGPGGRFHRNADGTIFHVTHLARSRTNLPGYITNGNTPQGVFTVDGLSRTKNLGIGQTPFLLTMLPHEADPAKYFHNAALANTSWTQEMYLNLLPAAAAPGEPAWRDYLPMRVAWYAGAAGRSEMLSHGTAMDPTGYVGAPWYPTTPTSGCICAKELWDNDGKPLVSEQLALAQAWLEASGVSIPRDKGEAILTLPGGGPTGYFAVIELDQKNQPVTLDEVVTEILAAEEGHTKP